MTDPITALHYAPNGNFVNGVYAPGADGFNLADVSSVSGLNALPPGVKGLVYLGLTNGADANFQATVSAFIGNPNLYGFYVADEPGAGLAANLKAEADWIHANVPGAKTFIVEQNLGSQASPVFAYTPANTDIDLFGLDPYPLNVNLPNNLDYGVIARDVSAAEAAGVPQSKIVPVYQAFGGGGYSDWILPTPAQEEQILSTWGSVVPTPAFDYAYSWGAQDGDTALSNDPALQQIFAAHNGASAVPAAPTIARPANGSTDTTTTKPVISGGGVTGDTVTISIDGTRVGTAPVVNSAWTFTPTSPLSNASHRVTATQAASGGPSSTAATDTFTVKVQAAPAAPTIARPANGSTDTTTTKPVISGGGVTGDTVTISIDGTRVGTAPVVNSAWTFTPTSPLSNASHRVTATQAASGGLSSTAATDTFTVKVQAAAPAAPTIARPANGSTDTTTTKPVISGGGVTGDTVTISIDGTRVGTAPVVNSAWTFTPTSPLSNASHRITATQAASGGPSSTAATDTFTVKVQAAAPAAPTIARPANGSTDTTTTKPVISGGGVTGDTVTISIDGTRVGTAPVVNSAWTFTPTSPLSNASHRITATQAASGGPSSTAATDTFTVKVAPLAPTLSIADSSLSVAGHGGTVDLGISVTAPASATATTVRITGLPKYETITDSLDRRIFRGSSITLSEAEVDSGLTLTSYYQGSKHPVATLTITASDQIGGVSTTSAPRSIKVTDPTTSTDAHQAIMDHSINALSSFSATTGGAANKLSSSESTHWSPAIADFASHASGHGLDNFASPSAEFAGLAALLTSETNMGFNQPIGAAEGHDSMHLGPNVASAGLNADFHFKG